MCKSDLSSNKKHKRCYFLYRWIRYISSLNPKTAEYITNFVLLTGVSATLAALTPRLKDVHQLLVDPPPVRNNHVYCISSNDSLLSVNRLPQ